jgi:hypothetical protein
MKKVMGFYRTFLQTITPSSYEDFAESTTKNTFGYYGSLIFNAFVIMLLLLIPTAIQLPNTIESYFDNVETMNFDIEFKTSAPIAIPQNNPLLLINYNNQTPTQSANIILHNNVLYGGFALQKFTKDFSVYQDAKANKNPISNILAFFFLLMVPTLLLIFFFYILIRYFLVVIVASLAGQILAPILKRRVTFKKMFNCAVYGVSATVFLDIIFFALGFSFYYIQYLPLVIFMVSGILYAGQTVDTKMKGKYLEVKG